MGFAKNEFRPERDSFEAIKREVKRNYDDRQNRKIIELLESIDDKLKKTKEVKMQIHTTPHELMERNLYDKAADILGINPYAIKEGLLDPHEQLTLTGKEAVEIGLVKEQDDS